MSATLNFANFALAINSVLTIGIPVNRRTRRCDFWHDKGQTASDFLFQEIV